MCASVQALGGDSPSGVRVCKHGVETPPLGAATALPSVVAWCMDGGSEAQQGDCTSLTVVFDSGSMPVYVALTPKSPEVTGLWTYRDVQM